MKVNANSAPVLSYAVQRHPQQPDKAIVTLRENVVTVDENTVTYDEYIVIVPWYDNLTMEVAKNVDQWLASARSMEPSAATLAVAAEELADMQNALDILEEYADE